MAAIDRGERHPANQATELPARRTPVNMPGLAHLADAAHDARTDVDAGGRLVIEHGAGVMEAVSAWSPGPEILPPPRPRDGQPITCYLQVEFRPVAHLVAGEWRLVRDGLIVTGGCLAGVGGV